MFEEENRDFAKNENRIKGHLRVETGNNKGALRCTLENLRYFEKGEYIYKLIFIGMKKEKTVYEVMGTVSPNRAGNSETYFRFLPLDVDGKGNEYGDFHAAIVAAVSTIDEQESLHPVLKASLNSDAEIFRQRKPQEGSRNGIHKQNVEETVEKKSVEAGKPIEEENYNHFYNRYVLRACQYIAQLADKYENISPFERETDKTRATWKKVNSISNLPLVAPGAHYFAAKYQHYIFGGTETDFYIGIPGKFSKEEQPDGGESGFLYWQAVKVIPEEESVGITRDYGYWILRIEGKNGNILGL